MKRHCPKLTVFRAAANSSAAFKLGCLGSVGAFFRFRPASVTLATNVGKVFEGSLGQSRFDPGKARQYPQTVARKSAIRLRTRMVLPGDRAGQ